MTDLEPTPHVPKPPLDPASLRNKFVRTDLAAEALGLEEGTILTWAGQKKIRSMNMGARGILVRFSDVEKLLNRLPVPRDLYEQKEMIRKQAAQVQAAITRLLNLLHDTSQAGLFHQIPAFQSPVDSIDVRLWHVAMKAEEFRKVLGGSFYEEGYRIAVTAPAAEEEIKEQD